MNNIHEQILKEVDAVAPGYVQVMAEMMEECPTLKAVVDDMQGMYDDLAVIDRRRASQSTKEP